MKRIIGFFACFLVIQSIFGMVASSEARVSYNVSGDVLVDDNFRNISEIPQGYKVIGNAICGENGISFAKDKAGTIVGAESIDTDGEAYTIESTLAFSFNSAAIRFATDSSGSKNIGYSLDYKYSNTDKVHDFTLSKDGVKVAEALNVSGVYGVKKIKIELTESCIDIYIGSTHILTYERETDFIENGYIAWYSNYTDYSLRDFKVYTSGVKTTSSFIVDKTFTVADTVKSLEEEGIIITNGKVDGDRISFTKDAKDAKLMVSGITLSGDYTFKLAGLYKGYNTNFIYLNYQNDNNYYKIEMKGSSGKKYSVVKCIDGNSETVATGTLGDDATVRDDLYARVKNGENGEITLSIKFMANNIEYTDTENTIKSGSVGVAFSYAGNASVKGLKIFPGVSEFDFEPSINDVKASYVTVGNMDSITVFEKDFTSSDSADSLKKEGISVSNAASFGENRINFSSNTGKVMIDKVMNGSYTFTVKNFHKDQNYNYVYLNRKNSENYYKIEMAGSSKRWYKIYKCVDGVETQVLTGSMSYDKSDVNSVMNLVAKVTENADGSVSLKVTYMSNVIEYTDTENVISSGSAGLSFSYAGNVWIGGVELATDVGMQAFKLGTQILCENYTVISGLYENGRLVEVKSLAAGDLKSGYVSTFKATQNQEIKTYLFKDLKSLTPLVKPYKYSGVETDVVSHPLDRKRILFVGDSYVYYGHTVEPKYTFTQESRSNDKGIFYQICKANGADVSVTNWSYGSHGLQETFGDVCTEPTCKFVGQSHKDQLVDKYFDYVIISPPRGTNMSVRFSEVMDIFREVNPDVKFVCLGSAGIHGISRDDHVYTEMIEYYETLREQGVIIADWGDMVSDIINGEAFVPYAEQEYSRSTFVVKDNFHPNLLAGYITSMFAYCAITGESASGQSYSFITDSNAGSVLNIPDYLEVYYTNGAADTNFDEVFASENDMKGLQQMIDDYLEPVGAERLNNKKVLFIGNSHVHRGLTVLDKGYVPEQSVRDNDKGYFYQLCRANGINVSVTNWTFGAHHLYDMFGGECTTSRTCGGLNHESYLKSKDFDYVFISPGRGTKEEEEFIANFEYIMQVFKEANPNVKFICLGTAYSYGCNETGVTHPGITDSYKALAQKGVIIADWGRIVNGIINGDYVVEGAKEEYSKSSFIVSDAYHANMLTGYLTTLTAYCAVTGEKAEGQPYDFCGNTELATQFDMTAYINNYYKNGTDDTNMIEIFESSSDMRGLQRLVDYSLEKKEYLSNGVLDRKKVLFIGNSHTYRGLTVIPSSNSILTQSQRSADKGFFYQLCRANGMNVSVTNWTFGDHALGHLFGAECAVTGDCFGVKHEDYLTDRYFDYVIFTPGVGKSSEENIYTDVEYLMNLFSAVNPQVKFVLLGNVSVYGCNAQNTAYPGITDSYQTFAEQGITIADWGKAVKGILDGTYTVEGATEEYKKSSFIVSDQYHANMLTGYITTLTALGAITGKKAEGQPYDFCSNASLNSWFDFEAYVNKYYNNGADDTNMIKIFESESDMLGIQKIVDTALND